LLGTVDDWRLLRSKAEGLKQFEKTGNDEVEHFSVWLAALLPALDHFVSAAEGRPDIAFWGSVCNLSGGSGGVGDPITGWISVFFPYLNAKNQLERNGTVRKWIELFQYAKTHGVEAALGEAESGEREKCSVCGIKLQNFPGGLASAPLVVEWLDAGIEQNLMFYGGICAVHQHTDGALEPRTGWAVVEPVRKKESLLDSLFD
jgi:hypothetical protein